MFNYIFTKITNAHFQEIPNCSIYLSGTIINSIFEITDLKHAAMIFREKFVKHKAVFLYSISLGLLLFLLKWLELRFIIFNHSLEIYIGAIAVLFTALGIWLSQKLTKPKLQTIIIEKEILAKPEPPAGFEVNQKAIDQLGLSKREMEVLQLMAEGMSNTEIADRLFVSLNTIKTHVSKLFEKMDVKRRTQAIEMAKRLSLIP